MQTLLDLVYLPRDAWKTNVRVAISSALRERYVRISDLTDPRNDEKKLQLRFNGNLEEKSVPYVGLIPPDQDSSGGYGGMSFVLFPASEPGAPALIAMGVGTNGIAPDELILGRPGHARKCAAIAAWLNARIAGSAWAKRDPVRVDLKLPGPTTRQLHDWSSACEKYGHVLYATFAPPRERTPESDRVVEDALKAFLDLFFDERRIAVKKDAVDDAEQIRRAWLARVMPDATPDGVAELLTRRRFVILEGPPGTGKTELATSELLAKRYAGRGQVIQFHPGTTYESFLGGLAPSEGGAMGFTFRPRPGHLMEAAQAAARTPDKPYLLVIDEINRADLAKVLGEAIYLFEPDRPGRRIRLSHRFEGLPDDQTFLLPPNLHILGTMNSADRSIAILDVAVRRRFAFVPLWPQLQVVERKAGGILQRAFQELLMLFVEHASDDALPLTPGHAYFLGSDEDAPKLLMTSVRPLLEEYLAQGYVSGFADEVRAYIDRSTQIVGR
jgi:5-methylcytosine-specific restriction protein B